MTIYSHWICTKHEVYLRRWFPTKKAMQEGWRKSEADGGTILNAREIKLDVTAIDFAEFLNGMERNRIEDIYDAATEMEEL